MCGIIRFSMSRSMPLKAVLSSVMGLYEVTSVESLLRFVEYCDSGCGNVVQCLNSEPLLKCFIHRETDSSIL